MQFTSLWDVSDWGDEATEQGRLTTLTSNKKIQRKWQKRGSMYQPTVGEELDIVRQDHCVKTHPANNHNRRTLVVTKQNSSWGFTIQSYGIHHKNHNSLEHLTYVDYVELNGPGHVAGMRKGDIILSINGMSMEDINHNNMVQYIKTCGDTMRMVVLFEDCSKKVELHLRYLKLKKLMGAKEFELNSIDEKIRHIKDGNRSVDPRRLSLASTSSTSTASGGSWDDRWSLKIDTPSALPPRLPLSLSPRLLLATSASTSRLQNNGTSVSHHSTLLPRSNSTPQHCESVCETPKQPAPVVPKILSPSGFKEDKNSLLGTPQAGDYHSLPVRGQKNRPQSLCLTPQSMLSPAKPGLASAHSHESLVSPSSITVTESPSLSNGSTGSPFSEDETHPSPATAFIRNIRTRTNLRSRSFRASFRNSMSPALGQSYKDSSNYVVTETNSRLETEPELMRLKQGAIEIHSPVLDASLKKAVSLTRSASTPNTHLCLPEDNKLKRSTENITAGYMLEPKRVKHESGDSLGERIDNCDGTDVVLRTPSRSELSARRTVDSRNLQNLCSYSYNQEKMYCDRLDSNGYIPSSNPPTVCSDSNCNGYPKQVNTNQVSHDANGNPTCSVDLSTTTKLFSALTVTDNSSKPRSILRSRSQSSEVGSRPWSTGSDLSTRSVSWSSSTSDLASPSSGTFEFYTDPFTPSSDEATSPQFPVNQKVSETPVVTSFRKMSKRILTYSRHKELIRQDLRLMNINEEEETTKL